MNHAPAARITRHRETARRARRLAGATNDQKTITAMTDAAEENDADADRIEADLENEGRGFISPR